MKKQRKIILVIIAALLVGATFGGYRYWQYEKEKKEMEELKRVERIHEVQYGELFGMVSDDIFMYRGASVEENGIENEENKEKEVVFLSSKPSDKDEACITIYPTEDTEIYLEGLNNHIRLDEIDVSQYNLSYPLTIEDIVHKREEVKAFLDDTHEGIKGLIFTGRYS